MAVKFKTKNRYLILALGMLMQLCAGIIYMWSVFKDPVTTHLSWNPAAAAITSSIMLAAFVIGIVIGGKLQDGAGPRPVAIAGSVLLGAGMLATAFVPASLPWIIYLTYGVLGGVGVGFVYTTTVSVIQKWFPDKRGFATGMMVGAFGFSLVLFAPITKTLLADIGVPKTFILFGIIFFVICFICSLFLLNPEQQSSAAASLSDKKQFTTAQMLKTKEFYLIAFSMFFLLSAYFILNPIFISLGRARGLSESAAILGVMITGIASATGRILASWASDLFGRKITLLILPIITLAASLMMITANASMFIICIALIAFCFGGSASVYATTTADIFGTKHIGLNYGCVMVAFGVSALVFPLISNKLASAGIYTLTFLLTSAACVVSIILLAFLKIPGTKKSR